MTAPRKPLSTTLAVAAIAALGMIAPALAEYGGDKDKKKSGNEYQSMIGQPAPAFTLEDTDGATHSLADFRGKTVVLHWQGVRCPWDQAYQPQFNQLAEQHADRGVVFIGINSNKNEDVELINGYKPKAGIEYPILKDPGNEVADAYHAKTTPHMYVIDGEGVLRYAGGVEAVPGTLGQVSEMDEQYLEPVIKAVAGGSEPPYTVTKSKGCSIKRVN